MLAITPGEPAGIGPDCIVRLACETREEAWVVLADADMLRARAQLLKVDLLIDHQLEAPSRTGGCLTVKHVPLAQNSSPGKLNRANAAGVLAALDLAVDGCLQGRFAAMVTGPVHKSVLSRDGRLFTGHTEYLQRRTGVDAVTMLLVADELRVAIATTHLALKDVPAALSQAGLTRQLQLLIAGLRDQFGIDSPRVLVTGLNPHAGEDGQMGSEEIDIIRPVCDRFRADGYRVEGPMPADTVFTSQHLQQADAVLAMYHDQGLPVLKYAGFGRGVNVTLGLPFVRTSVDHGTALDIAGTGTADAGSMAAAIALGNRLR